MNRHGLAGTIGLAVMLAAAGIVAAPAALAQSSVPAAAPLDADAAAALDNMGRHLRSLQRFEVTAESRLERAFASGQVLEMRQDTRYLVQMPDRMMVDMESDAAHRRAYYDGKTLTVHGLKAAKYVSVPMTGSIGDVLTAAYDNLGLEFPLQDLFRWGSPSSVTLPPTSGFKVGDSRVQGRKAAHYAFRMPDVDFQIWIADGADAVPLRMVITRSDTPGLRYAADFRWNMAPTITPTSFTFKPGAGDTAIDIAAAAPAR